MKTACLVVVLTLMVMTVKSTPSSRFRRVQQTKKVYEDPSPCDADCYSVCCEGDCATDAKLKNICDVECGCKKRTLEDPSPCDKECYDDCCTTENGEKECSDGSDQKATCESECGCRKRTLKGLMAKKRRTFFEDPSPCNNECYKGCCEGECSDGSKQKEICESECGCRKRTLEGLMAKRRRTFFEDPSPCNKECYDDCCKADNGEDDCSDGSDQKAICESECKCRKRTLEGLMAKRHRTFFEDPSPCNKECYDDCCKADNGEDDCSDGSDQKEICESECKCKKRTLEGLMAKRRRTFFEALKAKRTDEEEYPEELEYAHATAEECEACKMKECAGYSEMVCNEICSC